MTLGRARALRVVAAGRRIADPQDALGREARARLVESSGLSRAGVELALTQHLEVDPAPEHLDALLASSGSAPRCHVVLSSNVCTGALRAVAVAVATAPSVVVRASRRDPVIAGLLVRALSADPAFAAAGGTIVEAGTISAMAGDELHVYGGDEAVAALSAGAPPGAVVRGHGTGLGVAVVGEGVDLAAAAAGLARDVVPFDQRGCLSPRAALVGGGAERAVAFGEALDHSLAVLGEEVPRGDLDPATASDLALYRATIEAVGVFHGGEGHAVGVDPEPRALVLPPPARVVHVAAADAASAPALLAAWAGFVTSVGADDDGALTRAALAVVPGARRARLGAMQRPPLDGPVDRRASTQPRTR